MTRVLIVDDNALLRAGLATVIASDPALDVVGEAASGREALHRVAQTHPDIVLMDIEMPGGDGITATAALRALHPSVRVLILTMFDVDEYVADALRAGATGFLLKTTEPMALLQAIRDCAAGETTLGPSVVERLVESYVARPTPREVHPGLAHLTDREQEVLRSLADGRSNAEVAAHLHLAEPTVKTHVARILDKLEVRDRVQAVVIAHRSGWVRSGS